MTVAGHFLVGIMLGIVRGVRRDRLVMNFWMTAMILRYPSIDVMSHNRV